MENKLKNNSSDDEIELRGKLAFMIGEQANGARGDAILALIHQHTEKAVVEAEKHKWHEDLENLAGRGYITFEQKDDLWNKDRNPIELTSTEGETEDE